MAKVLITGMSGAGRSTVLLDLAARGYRAVDTDYDGCTLASGLWDETRVAGLLDSDRSLVLSATVQNQSKFCSRFDARRSSTGRPWK